MPSEMDLLALLAVEPGRTGALEWFVGSCLCEGGIWESPRTSDGIAGIERILERSPDALRVAGRIWQIDQTLHTFWLELKRVSERFAWVLYFDVIETSVRRARNALSDHDEAQEIAWRVKVAGDATVEIDKLAIVAGSTRVEVRDVSQPKRSEHERRRPSRRRRVRDYEPVYAGTMSDVEAARQRALARLQQQAEAAAAKSSDPYWRNGPFNVQRWVERGYNAAIGVLESNEPRPGEEPRAYLARMSTAVRELRDLGPDADDEAWYAGAIDDACVTITSDAS